MATKATKAVPFKVDYSDDYTEAYTTVVRERTLKAEEVEAAVRGAEEEAASEGDLYDLWYEPWAPGKGRLHCPYGIGLVRNQPATYADCCKEAVRLSKALPALAHHLVIARHGAKWLRYVCAGGFVFWGRANVKDVADFKPVSARLYHVVPHALVPCPAVR
jgi:hypothetical protein